MYVSSLYQRALAPNWLSISFSLFLSLSHCYSFLSLLYTVVHYFHFLISRNVYFYIYSVPPACSDSIVLTLNHHFYHSLVRFTM